MPSRPITINKSTGVTITIGAILSIAGAGFYVGSEMTSNKAVDTQQSKDIETFTGKVDDLSEKLDLATTNIIKLNARLDALGVQQSTSTASQAVQPESSQPESKVIVAPPKNATPPPNNEEYPENDSGESPLRGLVVSIFNSLSGTLL